MQVHVKHMDGSFEYVPYFCLPANKLNDVIAPSYVGCLLSVSLQYRV